MAGDLILRKLTNRDRSFYPIMGPFLSRREIVKEVGGPIWDDDTKRWYVALDGRKVAGFAATRDDDTRVTFQSAYTLPNYRRQGVYRMLLLARLGDYEERPVRSVCGEAVLPAMLAYGFTVHLSRGSFTEVRRGA